MNEIMFYLGKYLLSSSQLEVIINIKKQLFNFNTFEHVQYSTDLKKKYLSKCKKLLASKAIKKEPISNIQADNSQSLNTNTLSVDLVHWAISCKITNNAFSKLLNVLIKNGVHQLPQTPAVLFKHEENNIEVVSVPPGTYVHYGVTGKLRELINVLASKKLLAGNNVSLSMFIDHLQLNRTSNQGLWIILGSICGFRGTTFMIGAYVGNGMPENSNLFLKNFVDELKHLLCNGLMVHKEFYNLKIKRLICDAPAKAFILNTKSFQGYFSCTKCKEPGEYINNKICMPEKSTIKHNEDYEREDVYKGNEKTKLLEIPNFGVVTNVPLEYMHLVCLGVVRKLIAVWLTETFVTDEPNQDGPCEFQNKIKCLSAYKNWRPAQFRQFVLYYGPVVMKNSLSSKKYNHFLKLHLACRLLCLNSADEGLTSTAESLLDEFVTEFMSLYGKDHVTHNLHGLYHLAEDCRLHGKLDEFSAFPFEKYLNRVKNSIVKTRKKSYLQAVLKASEDKLFGETLKGLTVGQKVLNTKLKPFASDQIGYGKWQVYKTLKLKNWRIVGGQHGDDHVLLKSGQLVKVLNVLGRKQGEKSQPFVRGVELSPVTDYYTKPLISSKVGVYLVGEKESKPFIWPVDQIHRKCVKVATNTKNLVLCSMMNEEF